MFIINIIIVCTIKELVSFHNWSTSIFIALWKMLSCLLYFIRLSHNIRTNTQSKSLSDCSYHRVQTKSTIHFINSRSLACQWVSNAITRELINLETDTNVGITGNRTIRSIMSTETVRATSPALSQEVLGLNPHGVDINLASVDGAKHCMKATEKLPEKDKIKVPISNSLSVKAYFEKCR